MAKNVQQEEKEKVMTKYDRKMADRKAKAEADKKELKKAKMSGIAILIAIIVIVVGGIGLTIYSTSQLKTGTYVKVGEVEVTKPEYDYYFNVTSNEFISYYGEIFAMIGFDTTIDYAQQIYKDGLTWQDYFDQLTVESMTRIIALSEEAKATGFEYDTATDYATFLAQVDAAIAEYSMTESAYYTSSYGEYATKESVGELVKNSYYAEAYYTELQATSGVDDLEVAMTYNTDPSAYDSVDYYSFTSVTTTTDDMSEEAIELAIDLSKNVVEEFEERYLAGETFADLSVELSGEDQRSIYEETGGLFSGLSQSSVIENTAEWLFGDSRESGESTIVYNEETQSYSFLVFSDRYKSDTVDETIRETLETERAETYLEELLAGYALDDVKGEMNYLTISESVVEE